MSPNSFFVYVSEATWTVIEFLREIESRGQFHLRLLFSAAPVTLLRMHVVRWSAEPPVPPTQSANTVVFKSFKPKRTLKESIFGICLSLVSPVGVIECWRTCPKAPPYGACRSYFHFEGLVRHKHR